MSDGAVFSSCLGGSDDLDSVLLSEKCVRARRMHFCCECHGEIKCGQLYWYTKGVWSGNGFWSAKTCDICRRVRKSLVHGCVFYGELWEDIAATFCKSHEDR